MDLTQEECQALIDAEHDWETSTLRSNLGGFRDDTLDYRTFKEAPVVVLGKTDKRILKEIITKYEVNDFCKAHRDNQWPLIKEGWVARYVWITPLNDDYEGGELYVDSEVVKQEVGKTIRFNCRIPHAISKITKGTRYSLVSWVFEEDAGFISREQQREDRRQSSS